MTRPSVFGAKGAFSYRWPIAAVAALAIGCGYWLLIGACTPSQNGNGHTNTNGNGNGNDNTSGAVTISEATCSQLDETGNEFETKVEATSTSGRELS